MIILIDLGSTHNFMDPFLVKWGGMLVESNEKIRVRVANDEKVLSEGYYLVALKEKIQGSSFVI